MGIKKRDDVNAVMNMLTKKKEALQGFTTLTDQVQAEEAFAASFKTASAKRVSFGQSKVERKEFTDQKMMNIYPPPPPSRPKSSPLVSPSSPQR